MRYRLLVQRPTNSNLGTMYFYDRHEEIGTWDLVLGPEGKYDPTEYGNVTPNGLWIPIEDIAYRRHPIFNYSLTMCRILPIGDMKSKEYPKRTFDINRDSFMIHEFINYSTGCISIKGDFENFVKIFNGAFKEETFFITVETI